MKISTIYQKLSQFVDSLDILQSNVIPFPRLQLVHFSIEGNYFYGNGVQRLISALWDVSLNISLLIASQISPKMNNCYFSLITMLSVTIATTFFTSIIVANLTNGVHYICI